MILIFYMQNNLIFLVCVYETALTQAELLYHSTVYVYCNTVQYSVCVLQYSTIQCMRTAIQYNTVYAYCNTVQYSVCVLQYSTIQCMRTAILFLS